MKFASEAQEFLWVSLLQGAAKQGLAPKEAVEYADYCVTAYNARLEAKTVGKAETLDPQVLLLQRGLCSIRQP
jgi:hypothetical protein